MSLSHQDAEADLVAGRMDLQEKGCKDSQVGDGHNGPAKSLENSRIGRRNY